MKTIFFIGLMLVGLTTTATAQVDDIKRESRKNRGSGNNGGGTGFSGCDPTCCFALFDLLTLCSDIAASTGNSNNDDSRYDPDYEAYEEPPQQQVPADPPPDESPSLHESNLAREDELPDVGAFEVMLHAGPTDNPSLLMLPRLRGTYGMISSDLRINILHEGEKSDQYTTVDWQVIQLTIAAGEAALIRFGTGFMAEDSAVYHEHSFMLDMFFGRFNQNKIAVEFRVAPDYRENTVTPRLELSPRFEWRFVRKEHVGIGLNVGFVFQQYYGSVGVAAFQSGITFAFF